MFALTLETSGCLCHLAEKVKLGFYHGVDYDKKKDILDIIFCDHCCYMISLHWSRCLQIYCGTLLGIRLIDHCQL